MIAPLSTQGSGRETSTLKRWEDGKDSTKPPEHPTVPKALDQLGTDHAGFAPRVPVGTLQTYFGKYFMFNNYKLQDSHPGKSPSCVEPASLWPSVHFI